MAQYEVLSTEVILNRVRIRKFASTTSHVLVYFTLGGGRQTWRRLVQHGATSQGGRCQWPGQCCKGSTRLQQQTRKDPRRLSALASWTHAECPTHPATHFDAATHERSNIKVEKARVIIDPSVFNKSCHLGGRFLILTRSIFRILNGQQHGPIRI
jgi:hypothetical protein